MKKTLIIGAVMMFSSSVFSAEWLAYDGGFACYKDGTGGSDLHQPSIDNKADCEAAGAYWVGGKGKFRKPKKQLKE
jgi:hypothetical protein